MGIAIALAQYLVNGGIEYELVPHPHTQTASGSAVASQVPAESVAKAVVLKGAELREGTDKRFLNNEAGKEAKTHKMCGYWKPKDGLGWRGRVQRPDLRNH